MGGPTERMMTEGRFDAVARRFRVLSDPLRLKLLYHMSAGEHAVSQLVEKTGSSQPNVSKHLSTLLSHGLVQRRREANQVFYSIADPSVFELCDQVCSGIDRDLERRRQSLG